VQRFQEQIVDLSALLVSPESEKLVNVRSFDLNATAKLPTRISSVAAIGYRMDSLKHLWATASNF
jgi:hypothetical protein